MSKETYKVTDTISVEGGTTVDVLLFAHLKGSADLRIAQNLFYASESGMRL